MRPVKNKARKISGNVAKLMQSYGGCKDGQCGCDGAEHPVMAVEEGKKKRPKLMKLKRGIHMDTGAHDNVMPERMVGKRKSDHLRGLSEA